MALLVGLRRRASPNGRCRRQRRRSCPSESRLTKCPVLVRLQLRLHDARAPGVAMGTLSSSAAAAAAAAARIHLPPLAAAADAASADEVLFGEEGDGGEERRATEGQQDGVHDAASRLGREHSSPEVQVVVTPDSLDNLMQKLLFAKNQLRLQ